MKVKARQSGLTLMEMTVVISVVALLAVFGLPAIRALVNSFESEGGAKAMISASLASGRAIAAKEHHYAGIRFQKACDPNDPDPLNAPQYMVFIIHDTKIKPGEQGNLSCRAVEGIKPIKLPGSLGVMEVMDSNSNSDIDEDKEVIDKTTFSILFSPSGKLIIHDLWVRNRDGKPEGNNSSKDDIFNSENNVTDTLNPVGMFVQDKTDDIEPSRRSFIIYDKSEFDKVDGNRRWSDYLKYLEVIYINPYTGTMIKR